MNKVTKIALVASCMAFGFLAADMGMHKDFQERNVNIQVQPDGAKVIKGDEGGEIIIKPDGTKVIKTPDGTVIEKKADGSKVVIKPDGTRVNIDVSGKVMDKSAETVTHESTTFTK